jgi:carboxyl-terminal processing protease
MILSDAKNRLKVGVRHVKKNTVLLLAVLLILSNVMTYQITRSADPLTEPSPVEVDNGVNEGMPTELLPFLEVLDILNSRYLDEVTREELLEAAIQGMVDMLDDPQTSFLDATHWEEMMIKLDGSFSGIGIEITSDQDYITVLVPIKNTPGERAGLLSGDRIVAVDGEDTIGISTTEAVKLMRGPVDTKVTLTVERPGVDGQLTFEIIRANIILPSVFPEMLENNMGYIEITTFDDHTGGDFQEALLELEAQGMKGLILDLRNNPGGLLSEAIKIGQELLPAGPITHMVDRDGKIEKTYLSYGVKKDYPIVVLVNGSSASASEIIAGAIQDTESGVLVGTKTYGKATVQSLENLSNRAGLRFTVAKYQTPNGRDIHDVGLEPDVVIELPEEAYLLFHRIVSDLEPGDEDPTVMFLQRMLKTLKYDVSDSGVYDSDTEKAVRSFQSNRGLTETGAINQETRVILDEEVEKELKRLDVQLKKAKEILRTNM